jgi:heterodisulfide reductase subunit C2
MNTQRPLISFAPEAHPRAVDRKLRTIQDMVRACMQCGTCTASCPNAFAMDLSPRQMWRMLLFGLTQEVLESHTFWLCSSCYSCTLRCPRGLPLTAAMAALKRLASVEGDRANIKKALFYQEFMRSVEQNGRVHEMGFMSHYFLAMHDPLLPLTYGPLGLKLLRKGKLRLGGGRQRGRLGPLFAKIRSMEAAS